MTGKRFSIFCFIMMMILAMDIDALDAAPNAREVPQNRQNPVGDKGEDREKARLLERIEALEKEMKWVQHQQRQYQTYIDRQEKDLAECRRRKAEADRFERDLSPYLAEVIVELETFIQNDLDFLPEERSRRISFLQKTLADYHLDSGEKLRRVMEALRVEAGYGREIEKSDVEIELNGRPTQVELLRLGRIALYYRTPDGRSMGYRSKGASSWIPLPAKYGRSLKKAFELAEGRRAAELVTLPVGKVEK